MDEYLKWIKEEINDLDKNKPDYLLGLFEDLEKKEIKECFIEDCKKDIEGNEDFKNPDVIDFLSGFKLSKLLGIGK